MGDMSESLKLKLKVWATLQLLHRASHNQSLVDWRLDYLQKVSLNQYFLLGMPGPLYQTNCHLNRAEKIMIFCQSFKKIEQKKEILKLSLYLVNVCRTQKTAL